MFDLPLGVRPMQSCKVCGALNYLCRHRFAEPTETWRVGLDHQTCTDATRNS